MRSVRRWGARLILAIVAAAAAASRPCADPWDADISAIEDNGDGLPHFEVWVGAQAFRHAWSLYSGATVAPLGGIREDGLRLRVVSGFGAYSYSGLRAVGLASEIVEFHGLSTFADLLVGYHKQLGPLTLKAFAGVMLADHELRPDDPETRIRGLGTGGKLALEGWWNISNQIWSSLDLSWGSLYATYAGRARLGWRLQPTLSVGLEAGAVGNVECDIARIGAFVRYEWESGEVSLSAGAASEALLADLGPTNAATSSTPFATLSWLTRF